MFHDETLGRLTSAEGPVVERPLGELVQIGYRQCSDRIQPLAGLLEQVAGKTPLVIELKSLWDGGDALERHVAEQLRNYQGHAAVMSFDPRSIAALRRIAPALTRGIVACRFADAGEWPMLNAWQRFAMRHLLHWQRTKPDFISYDLQDLSSLAPRLVRASGCPLITWTVRSEADHARAAGRADQITFEGFLPAVSP